MKLTTIGLALALALPGKIALAEGTLNYSLPVVRPVVRGLTVPGPRRSGLRTSPSRNSLPLMRDPRGATLAPLTVSRDSLFVPF
jgi:hypothetical protein